MTDEEILANASPAEVDEAKRVQRESEALFPMFDDLLEGQDRSVVVSIAGMILGKAAALNGDRDADKVLAAIRSVVEVYRQKVEISLELGDCQGPMQ